MEMEKKFYLVWNRSAITQDIPTKAHETYEAAKDEAARLSKKHHNTAFYVLVAISRVEAVATITTTDLL